MVRPQFKISLQAVNLYKFSAMINKKSASLANRINILPQVVEINMYTSLFDPFKRAEIAVKDYIGIFVNFPLTGEEVIELIYQRDDDAKILTSYYIIDSVSNIIADDNARALMYSLNLTSIEAYVNARRTVSHAYHGSVVNAATELYREYLVEPIQRYFPEFKGTPLTSEADQSDQGRTICVPNLHPVEALQWMTRLATASDPQHASFMFYQTQERFHFRSLQGIYEELQNPTLRGRVYENSYKYTSNDVEASKALSNNGKLITNLEFNHRHTTIEKVTKGFFQSAYYEINMAQKSFQITKKRQEDIKTIDKHGMNTAVFEQFTPIDDQPDEVSNLTKYVINNFEEGDTQYAMGSFRERWGRNTAANVALSQVDLTISVPGDISLDVGQLIHIEVPKMHGFNELGPDPYLTGYFIIAEVKQLITIGGGHATVLRINKDSYGTSVDKPSEYAGGLLG